MKKSILNISLLCIIIWLVLPEMSCYSKRRYSDIQKTIPPPDDVYDRTDLYQEASVESISYQEFYDELSPYGSWIDYPDYGYVWIPRVSVDFHPYATNGYWAMTNYGWTWISDFHWGWAAFHYGRWAFEPRFGWMWVPGRVWGPAWVAWRESDDYFGWAPLGPFANVSITVVVDCPFDHYRFVPRRYFTNRHLYNYYADRHNNKVIINRTRVVNETHVVNRNRYYYGPRKDIVESSVGEKIKTAEVSDHPKPDADRMDNDRVKVYRPRMDNVPTNNRKPTPKKIVPATDLPSVPTDRRLTPNVKREKPQNTEGGEVKPQDKQPRRNDVPREQPNLKKEPEPVFLPRPVERQPRRENIPAPDVPDVKKEPAPKVEPRPQDRQPRKKELPQDQPNVKRQPAPKTEPRTQDRQPRREATPRETPSKTQPKVDQPRKEKVNPPPAKEKAVEPPKKKNRDNIDNID